LITYLFWDFGVENDKGKIEYDLSKEIEKAYHYFVGKFGVYPDLCKIRLLDEKTGSLLDFDGHKLTVSIDKMVAPRNLWLGMSDEKVELKPKE
jgi:hypothetical protein